MRRQALVACNALAQVLTPLVSEDTIIRILDIGLHVSPDRLRARLLAEIAAVEQEGLDILLGYGLCGRGTEGLVSSQSRLILPRVDDCVGALLGSRTRHRQVLRKCPGCYFLEPNWLDTELNIFEEISKGIDRIPADRRDQIIKMALKHYNTLALLSENNGTSPAWRQCEIYGSAYDLNLVHLPTDYSLLRRLIKGPWDSKDFVVVEPGKPIPLF
jgi:hypothetical protein